MTLVAAQLSLSLPIVEEARAEPVAIVPPPPTARPRTRGECEDGPRPCPWASCRYNLLVDVTDSGGLVFNLGGEITRARAAARIIGRDDEPEKFETAADEAIGWWEAEAARADLEGEAPPPSCALDVADEGSHMLDDIGGFMNVTRERIRQLEGKALFELKCRSQRLRRKLGIEE